MTVPVEDELYVGAHAYKFGRVPSSVYLLERKLFMHTADTVMRDKRHTRVIMTKSETCGQIAAVLKSSINPSDHFIQQRSCHLSSIEWQLL